MERFPASLRNTCGKITQRKRKYKDTKRYPYGHTRKKRRGYVIRQPITFEISMDE